MAKMMRVAPVGVTEGIQARIRRMRRAAEGLRVSGLTDAALELERIADGDEARIKPFVSN